MDGGCSSNSTDYVLILMTVAHFMLVKLQKCQMATGQGEQICLRLRGFFHMIKISSVSLRRVVFSTADVPGPGYSKSKHLSPSG